MDDLLEEMDSFERPAPTDRARRRRVVATTAICGLAFVGIGQLATGALFEDSATASVSYASGSVEVEANGSAAVVLTAATNLAPGDTTYRSVAVHNAGSLDLRYAVSGETTAETKSLSTVLRYAVYSGLTPAACASGTLTGSTTLASNLTVPFSPPASPVVTPMVGSSVNGANPGDQSLAAGAAAQDLCVAMTLPIATTSTYASASATLKLTFDAEQTAHNP